jgi:myo-inositol-1(or 4)-monophosphatase
MMPASIEKRFELACYLARECGDLAVAERRAAGFSVRLKGPQDFVTDVDLRIESAIRSRVAVEFPLDAVLGEEAGISRDGGEIVWLIDPIDGTANFVHNLGHWSISIAAMEGDRLIFGVVHDPQREEMFTAIAGRGAFCDSVRLRAGDVASLAEATIGVGYCTGFPPARHAASIDGLLSAGASYRDPGSAALSLAYVAAGRLDGYVEAGITSWDIAAGILIVTEAGGFATPLASGDARDRPTAVIASAPGIAEGLRACLRRAWCDPDYAGSPVPEWMRATAL